MTKAELYKYHAQQWAEVYPSETFKCLKYKAAKFESETVISKSKVGLTIYNLVSEGLNVHWGGIYDDIVAWEYPYRVPSSNNIREKSDLATIQFYPTETIAKYNKVVTHQLAIFNAMKKRPAMYFIGGGKIASLRNYLWGLLQGFEYFGLEPAWEYKREAELRRGWDANSNVDSDFYMEKAGYSEKEIFEEYLDITIEMWQCTLDKIKDIHQNYNKS